MDACSENFDDFSDFDNSEYQVVMQITRLKWKIVGGAVIIHKSYILPLR